ncbi:hypothetical protein GCM10009817_29330 [Terrabacter lapilli]|uniref:Uncharacterized protein n=1 Tax=Terrabacter lapilli TaxID=436231 RepID=A0ABN2SFY9_9MICO
MRTRIGVTKLLKLKSKSAVKKPAPSCAGSGTLDMPPDPPVPPAGVTGGGGGGVAPVPAPVVPGVPGAPGGPGVPDWLLGIGVVGSLPTGRLKDGCSGGF